MAYIDQLVNVSISLATGGLSRASFSTANFASFHPWFTERIRFYSDIASVAEDFPTWSAEYAAAQAYFSQSPVPNSLAISRLQADAITVDVVGEAAYDDTATYSIDINGNGPYTSTGAGSAILTATALVAAAVADPDVTFSDNADGTYDVTAQVAGTAFEVTSLDAKQSFVIKTEGETWTAGLNAILDESTAWYALAINSRTEADVLLAAAWAQSNAKRIFLTASNDTEIITTAVGADTGSIAKQLYDLGYTRTGCIYHSKADGATNEQWIEMAWYGDNLTVDLDIQTTTWAFSQLIGITADELTDTQIQNATGTSESPTSGKNCNVFIPVGGANIMQRGQMVEGEWIDTITGVDWLNARIQENAYAALVRAKAKSLKIPYTNKGLQVIPNEVIAVLKRGQATQFLDVDPQYEPFGFQVTWPQKQDIPAAEISARIQKKIKFTATLAGAIHATTITGILSI